MTLPEFLLARIAEDEAGADDVHRVGCGASPDEQGYTYPCDCGQPARLLAECEAKRRIVGVNAAPDWPQGDDRYTLGWQDSAHAVLRALALPYASHPDYDEAWRP
ncbi:hypothetical protein DNL40_02390 [Xylanimonas oleitrophica]|uniref:Uncharacterized protein n=1 Tax=Xylanimonas oleitrophica TaxID=2607479 RepID=A0A2W5WUT4_9MICO|nr:DUF6221 family protein [Xylanimonas oleitrophica]PZR55239.1 hypothetical protein DNL40_02390 [Xylanimonas oleitrophica]